MDPMSFSKVGGGISSSAMRRTATAEQPMEVAAGLPVVGLLTRLAGPAPAEATRIDVTPPPGVATRPATPAPSSLAAGAVFERPAVAFERPVTFDPSILERVPIGPIIEPRIPLPFFPPIFLPPPPSKTATQLAQSAIVNLTQAPRETLQEAVNTITIKHPAADTLLDYFERKVRVGEVLNQLAATWSATTVGDFADAFQMERSKTAVMDAIVSISILSNPKLDEEILAENLHDAAPQDVLDSRAVAFQWPAPGTVMNPPYLMLVAVEYRDVAQAEDIVHSIMGELVDHQGMKLPRAAAEKL